ncbi:uncharacterized protein L203_103791 [Cryptococcus depauperatus CBS 7841]|uniref:Uncharacterized protein n=1 Tax=Cryptococcus depauperatus CBS 7841 TaxID=1295531 RepID=A0AAJ8JU93_9TREE
MLFSILKNADIARTKRRPAFTSRNHLSSHLSVCHPTYNPYDPIFLIVRPAFGAHQRWMGGWVRGKGKQLRTLSGIAWPWDGLNGYSLIVEGSLKHMPTVKETDLFSLSSIILKPCLFAWKLLSRKHLRNTPSIS